MISFSECVVIVLCKALVALGMKTNRAQDMKMMGRVGFRCTPSTTLNYWREIEMADLKPCLEVIRFE